MRRYQGRAPGSQPNCINGSPAVQTDPVERASSVPGRGGPRSRGNRPAASRAAAGPCPGVRWRPGTPARPHGQRGRCPRARHHVPVHMAQGPGGDTVSDPARAPRPAQRPAPGRSRWPRRPRGPEPSPQCRRAGEPRAEPATPAPSRPGTGAARPLRSPAPPQSRGGIRRRAGTDRAPTGTAAPAPPPPAAPRPAPSHLPRRAAPLGQPAAPQSPLPDFHFLSL